MIDMSNVKSVAIWTSVVTTVFVLVVLSLVKPMPLPAILAALSLVSVGSAVVGALVALSFGEQDEH